MPDPPSLLCVQHADSLPQGIHCWLFSAQAPSVQPKTALLPCS